MKKRYVKYVNYQNLLLATLKEKYINLILGMLVAFFIFSLTYKYFLKNIHLNLAINLPGFEIRSKKIEKKIAKQNVVKTYVVEEGEDGYLISDVVELPGCHTQAKNYDELMKRTKEAISLYLEVKKPLEIRNKFLSLQQLEV